MFEVGFSFAQFAYLHKFSSLDCPSFCSDHKRSSCFSIAALAMSQRVQNSTSQARIFSSWEELYAGAVSLDEEHRCTVRLRNCFNNGLQFIGVTIVNDYDGEHDVVYDSYRGAAGHDASLQVFQWKNLSSETLLKVPPASPLVPPLAEMYATALAARFGTGVWSVAADFDVYL